MTVLESSSKSLLHSLLEKSRAKSGLHFEKISVPDYECVLKVTDEKSNLQAIISLHSLALGPALGGIRIFPYANFSEALEDALRLSKGMTYKAALAEVGIGGGKTVIIADPKEKTEQMLLAFGQAVDQLQGIYICAEDVNCTVEDVKVIRRATKYVTGLPHHKSSGDPARFTAWGTFRGIQATAKKLFGSSSLKGKTVAVQGLGSVGRILVDFLFWAEAKVIVCDLREEHIQKCRELYDVEVVSPEKIFSTQCDILAPCAMGGVINDETLPFLRCKGIAGCANNQLLKDSHGEELHRRGILYAPDFVINAGGLYNVCTEILPEGYSPTVARDKVNLIYEQLLSIYEVAEQKNVSTNEATIAIGDYRIQYGIGKRVEAPVFHHNG